MKNGVGNHDVKPSRLDFFEDVMTLATMIPKRNRQWPRRFGWNCCLNSLHQGIKYEYHESTLEDAVNMR